MSAPNQPNLFEGKASMEESINNIYAHLRKSGVKDYAITFGMFRTKNGKEYANAMVAVTDKSGKPHVLPVSADNFHHMVRQVVNQLKTVK